MECFLGVDFNGVRVGLTILEDDAREFIQLLMIAYAVFAITDLVW